jgi:hypothetical protein
LTVGFARLQAKASGLELQVAAEHADLIAAREPIIQNELENLAGELSLKESEAASLRARLYGFSTCSNGPMLISYDLLKGDGYKHGTVKHGEKEWSYYDYRHDAVHNTNRVESFWKLFKKSIASTHIHISTKYAERYLDEFSFRSNHRQIGNAMFDLLIAAL